MPNSLRLILSGVCLLAITYFSWQIIVQSKERKVLVLENAEVHNIKYGLLSVHAWKKQVSDIINKKIEEFELTESSMLEDLDLAIDISNQLQQSGFHVALDDFGTGYSSLSYIQNLPVNVIKLDYSFVKKIPQDIRSGFVVEHIISLAHKLGLIIVAEGVEEANQLDYLGNLNVDMIQGFYFFKPMPIDKICQLDLAVHNYK